MKKLLPYIVDTIKRSNAKYEIHSFDSGAVMVDLWIDNDFYVIQIDGDTIGFSLVTEETTPFDIIPDQSFKDEISFKKVFDNIFLNTRKAIFINGNNFSTLEEFYTEVDNVLTKDLDWTTGHNFDAFNDLLRGGFGVHEYEEPIKLIWKNNSKSKQKLGWDETIKYITAKLKTCHPTNVQFIKDDLELAKQQKGHILFELIVDIIRTHKHIELDLN